MSAATTVGCRVNTVGKTSGRLRFDLLPESVGEMPDRLTNASEDERDTVLSKVRYIIDCDGYTIRGAFYPCEIAVVNQWTRSTSTWALSVPTEVVRGMTTMDRRSANYVYRKVHGMPMERFGPDVRTYESTIAELRALFASAGCAVIDNNDCRVEPCLVAYKGGDIERDLLTEMGVYRVDLGTLGCPKTDVVLSTAKRAGLLASRCDRCVRSRLSTKSGGGGVLHCSRIEVCALADWCAKRINC